MQEILDMKDFLGISGDEEPSDVAPEDLTLPPLTTDLTQEDLERRNLISLQRREALEAVDTEPST